MTIRPVSPPTLPLTAAAFARRADRVRQEWEKTGLFWVHVDSNKQRITITPRDA